MRRISCLLVAWVLVSGCAGPKRLPPVLPGPEWPPLTEHPPAVTDSLVAVLPGVAVPALLGVGLLENATDVAVGAAGEAALVDGGDGEMLAYLEGSGESVVLQRQGSQVAWRVGSERGKAASVILRPYDPGTRVSWGKLRYRGEFLVICSPSGSGLTLINTVDLESYLKGVVPWEIGRHPATHMAALEAQAVAARTYTVSHLGSRRSRGFDVLASVMDQVYKGAADEDELCSQAVDATAGLILMAEGEEVEAYYSACCGGVSSNIDEVWARGGRSYLRAAPDGPDADGMAHCAGSKYFTWQETWSRSELEKILAETLPEYLDWAQEGTNRREWTGRTFVPREKGASPRRPGRLRTIEVLRRTTSGRVADLAIGTEAGTYHVRGDRTRWVLRPASGNPFILRSAKFAVDLSRDGDRLSRVTVRGQGFGHGIGLCQTGALARAAAGHTYGEILAHYYPGAALVRAATVGGS